MGALLGSAIGFAVPFIHTLTSGKGVAASVSPFSFLLHIEL